MRRIYNYSFIICLNLLIFFFYDIDSQLVIFFSIACALLFSSEFLQPTKISFFISYTYLFLCFFYPIAFLFLPIASYSHAKSIGKSIDANILCPFVKYTPIMYLPLFIMMWDLKTEDTTFQFFFILFICILSFLLEYHSYSYKKAYHHFYSEEY
jgi:cytochrome bd-type quinol oxidase subunit 2